MIKTNKTIVGYQLGSLKLREDHLLQERSFLRMELAKLTTKKSLQKLARKRD